MIASQDLDRIQGATAYDSNGEKVGKVAQIYTEDTTGEPTWVSVSTGLFGLSESMAPLANASFEGDDLRLSYDKAMIKDAPRVEGDQSLDADEERRLYEHYGLDYAVGGPEAGGGTGSLGAGGGGGDLGADVGYGGGQGGYSGQTQRTADANFPGGDPIAPGYEAGDVVERGQTGYDSPSGLRLRRYLEEGRG